MSRTRPLTWLLLALVVSIVPPSFADTYFVYQDAGIPLQSNLFTWCDTPPCDVAAPSTCANPEGSLSLRVRTNVWGGWGIFLSQTEDLSAFENGEMRFFVKAPSSTIGSFDVKVEFSCVPDPVNDPAGDTYTTSIAAHGWDGTNAWQRISIPICDFFPGGVCDTQCLSTVSAPFLSTIENLPFFNAFQVDDVRWYVPNAHPGPSTVEVQGRELLVNGEPFVVNGVAYAPISIGENWYGAWRDRPDRYFVDFPLIAASGANVVRLYAPLVSTAMLDAAWAEGLYVIPSFAPNTTQMTCPVGRDYMRDEFVEMVDDWKDHPAVLFWLVGNEVNANLGPADLCTDWFTQLDSLAAAAHAAEGASFHPVATANADLGDICLSGCSDDTALPNVDLWATQIYRGCSFTTAFDEYSARSDCERPLVVTEFGSDSWDSLLGPMGSESETMQSDCIESLLAEADEALAVRTPGGVSSGVVVFEWADEWWKAECEPTTEWTTHDTCASFQNFAYPDPDINEEWWGVASVDSADPDARGLRAAYDRMGESWNLGDVCSLGVLSSDAVSGQIALSFDPAPGSTDHTLHYGPLTQVSSYGYSGSVGGLGATGSATATLPSGSWFWLVVGRNNGEEGGYSDGVTERPPAPGAAVPQDPNRTGLCSAP